MAKVRLNNLGKTQLKNLRSDIVLNSLYISDYENRYDIDPNAVCDFFDGFMDYIGELCNEDHPGDFENHIWDYDTPENLWEYYCMIEWY